MILRLTLLLKCDESIPMLQIKILFLAVGKVVHETRL